MREQFIRSLDALPTDSAASAAAHLRRELHLTAGIQDDRKHFVLTRKRDFANVTVLGTKPLFGERDPSPHSFDLQYIEFGGNPDPSRIRARVTALLGAPALEDATFAYWPLARGVLRLRLPGSFLVFTPFTKRALLDQLRVTGSPALHAPAEAAHLAMIAHALAGRGTAPDPARLLALAFYQGSAASACVRRIDQDAFAICAGVVNSDDPRHVFFDYIGPPLNIASDRVPLLAGLARMIGVETAPDTLESFLTSAIRAPSVEQRQLSGNYALQAKAYPAGSMQVLRLDACDRMGHVERELQSGDPCRF